MTRVTWMAIVAALGLVSCGGSAGGPGSASSAALPTATTDATPTSGATRPPAQRPPLLVLSELTSSGGVVRLTRLDASDVASTPGQFLSITSGDVVVLDGTMLKSMGYDGTVRTMGQLTGLLPSFTNFFVVVSPDRSQWVYVNVSRSLASTLHVGSSNSDRVLATLPSPDGRAYMVPFAWTGSGLYLVERPDGIGGAGPFLEYHFPLWRFRFDTLSASPVSPPCTVVSLAGNGTQLCSGDGFNRRYTILPPSGSPQQFTVPGQQSARGTLSLDGTRVAVARSGGTASSVSYQIATAGIGDSTATDFGPRDFVPVTWLPDGRLVASHQCVDPAFQGAPCDTSQDGAIYIFSADGTSSTLFYKWPATRDVHVVACLPGSA